jgi:hypothetical protein
MLATTQRMTTPGPRSARSRFASCRRAPRRRAVRPANRVSGQKTAPGGFFRSPSKRHLAQPSQVTETHQENSVCYYGIVSGCAVAPNRGAQTGGIYSIGRDIEGLRIGTHQFTAIVPRDISKAPSAYLVNLGDGRKGYTIGAHNVNGKLQVIVNQRGDLAAARENFSGNVVDGSWHPESYYVMLPKGVNVDTYGQSFLDAARNFGRNTRSDPIDYPTGGLGQNSNTWNVSIHQFLGGSTTTDFRGLEPGNNDRFPDNLFHSPQ